MARYWKLTTKDEQLTTRKMDNEEKLVVVAKYSSPVDANIVKGALEASGIPWMAPVRVVVFERDLELAKKVISETDEAAPDVTEE